MDTDAFDRAVIDGNEHRSLALAGHDRRQIAAPHHVDPLGGDPAVMGSRAMRAAGTLMGQQAMPRMSRRTRRRLVRMPAKRSRAHSLRSALAMERAVLQELPDSPPPSPCPTSRQEVPVSCASHRPSGGDGGRWSPATRPRSASPAAGHRPGPSRARPGGSSPRPPACQRAGGLQPLDLGLEQLVGHGQITDLLLQAADLVITSIGGPALQGCLASGKEASRQPLSSAAVTAIRADQLQILAPQQRSTASCLRRADIRRRCPGV